MLTFSHEVAAHLQRSVAEAWPAEACGLGFSAPEDPDRVVAVTSLTNVSGEAGHRFSADPGEVLRALEDATRQRRLHRVIFHSHPGARGSTPSSAPSVEDLSYARLGGGPAWPGIAHLIIGHVPDAPWSITAFTVEQAGGIRRIPVEGL